MLSYRGSFINPASSCEEIPAASKPGEYWITDNDNQTPTKVICDIISTSCADSTRDGTRVAYIDMTDPNQQCPDGLNLITRAQAPLRTCSTDQLGCVSITFPVGGVEYSQVYGRIKAYQSGSPDGFYPFFRDQDNIMIDDSYVDGVSLTHGQSPRQHIWTFVAAIHENSWRTELQCPCTNPSFGGTVPPFIGQDYFCDTGSRDFYQQIFYPNDPLWDGQGCGGTSTCCSFNNPPWFCKDLPQPTTDDIELRLCLDEPDNNEDVPIELIELYIQ